MLRQHQADRAGYRIDAAGVCFHYLIEQIVHQVLVITRAAIHDVCTQATVQHIVTRAAEQLIGQPTTKQAVVAVFPIQPVFAVERNCSGIAQRLVAT